MLATVQSLSLSLEGALVVIGVTGALLLADKLNKGNNNIKVQNKK